MKKFLIMLMVVAMASFLFVGCLGVTPDIPVAVTGVTLDKATLALVAEGATGTLVATVAPADATDPRITWVSSDEAVATVALGVVTPFTAGLTAITVTTVDGGFTDTCIVTVTAAIEPTPTSIAPVITEIGSISLYPTTTQYVKGGFTVKGYAPKYSEVQIYVDGAVVSTGYAWGVTEEFKISVSKTSLGVDGAKTLYATATEVGLEESDPSTTYKFTLDTVKPKIVSVAAEVGKDWVPGDLHGIVTVTFSEALDADTVDTIEDGDIEDWAVNSMSETAQPLCFLSTAELISPKVVELEIDYFHGNNPGGLIRVAYEDADAEAATTTPITDLAGNPAIKFSDFCQLEVED